MGFAAPAVNSGANCLASMLRVVLARREVDGVAWFVWLAAAVAEWFEFVSLDD